MKKEEADDRLVLPPQWELPKEFLDRFGRTAGRQRLMVHENHLLLVLHEIPKPSTSERTAVLFWHTPDGEWKARGGHGFASLKDHVDTYESKMDELDQSFDEAQSIEVTFQILNEAIPIYRAAKNMHQVLQKTREVLDDNKQIITLRDQAYEIERAAELLVSDAKNAIDYSIAKRTEAQAVRSEEISTAAHRMNMLLAIFFPVTAVASLLSTNLMTGLEGKKSPLLFWSIVTGSLLIGFMLRGAIGYRKKN